ncbi:hypothetical protein ABH931_007572 [Streptacidiphilus sp. MAP12-33]|uniref:hypothetical protein n=1 Tax=Streptacidiphilus sp. MAP12-33 TaxID=3156266 RepID=UPI003516430E
MAVVAITGGPGAPGATSAALALLLSWPLTEHRRVLLIEADPDGGAVLAGALQGEVQASKGLRHLALSDRRGRLLEEMWDQCIDLSPKGTGDRLLLPGLTDPAQATALHYTWEPLAEACRRLDGYGCDVIVDLGRSGGHGGSAVLAHRADAVVAVVRTTLRGLSGARPRVAALAAELTAAGAADALTLLLVREGPYAAAEVSRSLGVPVVGLFPFAPKDARVLSDGGGRTGDRRFQRSELMRAARSTGDELRALTSRRRLVARPPQAVPAPPVAGVVPTPDGAADTAVVPHSYGGLTPDPAPGPIPNPPGASTGHGAAAPYPYVVPAAAPVPAPLRVVPAPPAPGTPPGVPLAPVADTTHLGYRGAHSAPPADRPWPAAAQGGAPGQPPRRVPVPRVDGLTPSVGPWPNPSAEPPVPVQPRPAAPPAADPGPAPAAAHPWPNHAPVPASQPPGTAWPAAEPATAPAAAHLWPNHAPAPASQPPGTRRAGGHGEVPGPYPRSIREVLDLAAASELGVDPAGPSGPVASPIGPVTPGQAARLQAVHTEPTAPTAGEESANPFNPPHMVAMPPLAEHAPRPPAPEEFRPSEDAPHNGGDGPSGEVARVR